MANWKGKTCLVLTLTLVLGLPCFISATSPVGATTDVIEWSRVNIPREGEVGNWVLAGGSDVYHLTMASDGTLYA